MSFIVSTSPHLRSKQNTASIMRDVVIALVPTLVAAAVIFGLRALLVYGSMALLVWLLGNLSKIHKDKKA